MITDLLKFTVKEGVGDDVSEIMKSQMYNNLGDDGCVMARAFRSKTDPNEFFVLLGWEDQASIDKHLVTEHDKKFRENLDPFLTGPPEFIAWETLV